MAGGLLRHAFGFMLLGWRRILRGVLIAAGVAILVTEIAAMVATHSLLPGAPAQLVAAALALAVAYTTALTIFIWELATGLIDLIRVAEGEAEAGAHAAAVIAEREIGDVAAGLRRLVGLSAHPQPRPSTTAPASPSPRPVRAPSPSRARAVDSPIHPDATPTAETLAALAPLAARAVEYHNRVQQERQATASGAVAEQPNVASVTRLPPLPMNPVAATNLPRIEWTYEHPAVTPPVPAEPVGPVVGDEPLEDEPLVEPTLAPTDDEPVATGTTTSIADAHGESTAADEVSVPASPATPVHAAPGEPTPADAPSVDETTDDEATDELGDVSSLRDALHLSPLAAYVAPMAAPLAEQLATGVLASAMGHTLQQAAPHTAPATAPTAPAGNAAPGMVENVASGEATIPVAPGVTAGSDAQADRASGSSGDAILHAAGAGDAEADAHQTQPDLPVVAARLPVNTQPATPPDFGAPSAATQPLPGAHSTRPIVRATSPLTRPRSEQTRTTRPVTRPLPAQSGPRPSDPGSGGAGLWERLSQALVGRTPPPTSPRPATPATEADTAKPGDSSGGSDGAEA